MSKTAKVHNFVKILQNLPKIWSGNLHLINALAKHFHRHWRLVSFLLFTAIDDSTTLGETVL